MMLDFYTKGGPCGLLPAFARMVEYVEEFRQAMAESALESARGLAIVVA